MTEFLTSRSRRLTAQRCLRARYWMDEAFGTGFEPVRVAIPLATGGAVHAGLKLLMTSCMYLPESPWAPGAREVWYRDKVIEQAVATALEHFRQQCADRQLDLDELESQSYVYAEQLALTEALVRLAGLRVIPKILELYEVLEVERMDRAQLTTDTPALLPDRYYSTEPNKDTPWVHPFPDPSWSVLFRSIPDALVRSRADGDLYVISWKTTAEFDQRRDQDARTDMQGLSEPWALERRLEAWYASLVPGEDGKLISPHDQVPGWFVEHIQSGGASTIRGVQMIYLIKGQRRKASKESQADGAGSLYKTASPLIYGYMSDKSGTGPQFAWASEWSCTAPHPMRKSQWYPTGECPGDGRNHRRDESWKSFPVWQQADGVKFWIEQLDKGTITPEAGDALDQSWAMPVPHFRTRAAVESWERQTRSAEARIARELSVIREYEDAYADEKSHGHSGPAEDVFESLLGRLDESFPQSTERCGDWFHRRCPAWDLCHGPAEVSRDPLGSGLYQIKQAYTPEVEAVNG